jgi:hypothetical protein
MRYAIRGALLAGVIALTTVMTSSVVAASDGGRQGWWTQTNPGGVPASVSAPDVAPDELLVQGGETDNAPLAYAAIVRPVPDNIRTALLTVRVDTKALNVSGALRLCGLTAITFTPAQGGRISDAPPYDCTDEEFAALAIDGETYSFVATRFVHDGVFAGALLPGGSTTRIVLAKPDQDAVTTTTDRPPSSQRAVNDATSRQSPQRPDTPSGIGDVTAPAVTAPTVSGASVPQTAADAPFAQIESSEPTKARPALILVALAAITAAGLTWSRSGRRDRRSAASEAL